MRIVLTPSTVSLRLDSKVKREGSPDGMRNRAARALPEPARGSLPCTPELMRHFDLLR
jgi:hypothetical protein